MYDRFELQDTVALKLFLKWYIWLSGEILLFIWENTCCYSLCAAILVTRKIDLGCSKVLINFGIEVSKHFKSKKFNTRKIDKTTNAFWGIVYFHLP